VVASKFDAAGDRADELPERLAGALPISAVTGHNIPELVERLRDLVANARRAMPAPVGYVRHIVRDDPIRVERENGAWRVRGRRAERAVETTDLDNEEAVTRLQRLLITMGVERLLAEAGARAGDEVRIGGAAFDFEPETSPT
jgi:GTP-binding protein